jgi:hypothetical protein
MRGPTGQVVIDWVKSPCGEKFTTPDDELFTGEFWSGVRGLEFGIAADAAAAIEDRAHWTRLGL